MTRIAIYGAGGFGREVAWLVEECSTPEEPCAAVCFIDDDPELQGVVVNGIPVYSLAVAVGIHPAARVVGAVGSPPRREELMNKAGVAGLRPATLVHPDVKRSRWVEIGEGSVICRGTIITTNVLIGSHVQVNLCCTIGHDAILGDYATLGPGVHVSGFVHIGKRVYVGTGAVFVNGTSKAPLVIGDDAVIGAGACVTESVGPGITVVGVPARAAKKRRQIPVRER